MKNQSQRDEQAVTIATTLALLVGVMLIGAAAFWLLEQMSDLSVRTEREIVTATVIAAVLISGRYLLRHRRP